MSIQNTASADYSNLTGKKCLLRSGTEIIIQVTGRFTPVHVGNSYTVNVIKVKFWTSQNLWYALFTFDEDLIRIVIPANKLSNYVYLEGAAALAKDLEGCK